MNTFFGFIVGMLQTVLSLFGIHAATSTLPQLPPPIQEQIVMQPTDTQELDASPHAVFPFVNDDAKALTYENTQYEFSLQYPSDVQISTTPAVQQSYTANINNGTQVVVIGPIQKSFTATEPDWGDNGVVTSTGKVIVSVSTNSTDVANCMTAPSAVEIGPTNITTKVINGAKFLSYDVDDPAAGLLELSHTYTTLRNGMCYSLDTSISGAESGHMNASDGAANNTVLSQLTTELDTIAQSFVFTAFGAPTYKTINNSALGISYAVPSTWDVNTTLDEALDPASQYKISDGYGFSVSVSTGSRANTAAMIYSSPDFNVLHVQQDGYQISQPVDGGADSIYTKIGNVTVSGYPAILFKTSGGKDFLYNYEELWIHAPQKDWYITFEDSTYPQTYPYEVPVLAAILASIKVTTP